LEANRGPENTQSIVASTGCDPYNPAIRELLEDLDRNVGSPRSVLAQLRAGAEAAIAHARAESSADAPDSPQQKMAKLWAEVAEANKKVDDYFGFLKEKGVDFDDADEKRRKDLQERLKANPHDLEAQKELAALENRMLTEAEPQIEKIAKTDPEVAERKKEVEPVISERDKKLEAIDNIREKDMASLEANENTKNFSKRMAIPQTDHSELKLQYSDANQVGTGQLSSPPRIESGVSTNQGISV
jgi:hypothetical protein